MLLQAAAVPRRPAPREGERSLWDLHAYVFTYHSNDKRPTFERTFPASCLTEAQAWIRKSWRIGFVSVNCLPKFYWR